MKNFSKNLFALLMAILLVFTASGCANKKKTVSNVEISEVNEFPIVKEKVELEIFVPKPSMIADLSTNEFTKWYEEKTGVHIKWDIAQGDKTQALNLRVASGDLPDIIMGCSLDVITVNSYGQQGLFIDHTDLIENHSYYYKKMLEEEPEIKQRCTMDGKMYGLANAVTTESTVTQNKMWVYQPWLDKLGLEIPTTTEEFYEMLKAFKEKDPNGNGKADEIPLVGRGVLYNYGIEDYLMNAFTYTNSYTKRLYVEKNKVKFSPVQDDYREGLKYINKLYKEGLLLKDVFVIDRTTLSSYGENNPPLIGAGTGLWAAMFTLAGSESGRINEYVAIPPLEGPNGLRQTANTNLGGTPTAFHITKDCEYPEVAMKWIDWFFSTEGKMKSEGVAGYREAKEGEIGLNGKQAKWAYDPVPEEEKSATFGQVQNENWGANWAPSYVPAENQGYTKLLDGDMNGVMYLESVNKYKPYLVNKEYPNIPIDPEVAAEYNDLELAIRDACDMAFAAFVTGERDINDDKEWKAFKDELKGYGLDQYLRLAQQRYDKYYKK